MKKIMLLAAAAFFAACGAVGADTITLKDEQQFEADVASFDDFYLSVTLTTGREASIPWNEVKSIKHTTTGSSWLEETHITPDDAEVGTLVVPLSKDAALMKSLFPGFAARGSGHFYAKDTNAGMSLLSAEIVSLIMMGLSVSELIQPQEGSQATVVSRVVFFTGLGIFTGSWLYDVIFSGGAVEKYNSEHTFLIQENNGNAGSSGK
jgi:hypothetical protein